MPTPLTVLQYHIAGPCVIQATVGAANAFAVVGVCEDGIEVFFRTLVREIKPDGAGGADGAPANFVFLNSVVVARCTLVPFAGVYLNNLRAAAEANLGGTPGTMVESGTLLTGGGVGNLVGVKFSSSDPDGGFWLRACLVKSAGDLKASPNVSKPRFEFYGINAFNPATTTTILGSTLYSRI